MSKRRSFLSIILLLSLSVAVQGRTTLEVINPSFEWADEVNLVTCHVGLDGVLGWTGGEEAGAATDWSGVDVNCGVEGMCDDCRDWHVFPDGNVVAYMDMGTNAYQLTDETITVGYKYKLTFDGMTWWSEEGWSQPIRASFYYLEDVCAPDGKHISLAETVHFVTGYEHDCGGGPDQCLDDWEYDLEAVYVVTDSDPAVGEKLGIKIGSPSYLTHPGSVWAWVDNVRLSWQWATTAYDPNPGDGAELVSKNPTLKWTPGLWAAEHEVYFGADETAVANADSSDTTGIYKGVQEPNYYTPSGPLVLGQTYYWKITEVNSTPPGGEIPAPPWEGDVWSFRVEGHAYDPSPEAGAVDVPFLGLELSWTAGADAENHDVYFGTDAAAVADATTSSFEYKTTLSVGTETYAIVEQLDVGETYYWRIDEKSAGGSHIITGDVWGFTVGAFLVADNFESYANNSALYEVWDDYWVNGSDGEMFIEKDVNIVLDRVFNPQAVLCEYRSSDKDDGVYFDVQDMSELEIGSDWTVGGVEALQLQMRGDEGTVLNESGGKLDYREAWPWVELEDTSSNTGYVLYPADDIMHVLSPYWHEWNIDLAIFDACGLDLTAIDRFTIGIGGAKADQKRTNDVVNSMWFDDIRLYPPRCRPEVSEAVGDFTGDCSVKYGDLDIMVTDWLLTDGNTATENRPAILTGFPDETSHWVTGYMGGAIEVNEGLNIDVTDPRLYGLKSMSITAWVKPIVGMDRWVGIVCSREYPCDEEGKATELGIYGSDSGGPDGLGYDWSCLSDAWKWDAEVDVVDGTWTFVAMAVNPEGCTLYARPEGGALLEGVRNWVEHPMQQSFANGFVIGNDNNDEPSYFVGAIDDVRIYTYDLNSVEVGYLAYQTAEPEPAPVYWYKFDDGSGLIAADSGTPTEVYRAVPSIANMVDPEPKLQRAVNFADYAILADNWMVQDFWP
ncbi:MAG: hypothetical protein JSW23_05705 [Planctomycetota bacterium]|nr:MAG: hypothetical protein JSW23_05705 [Planctomycetota bacterium]